MAGHFDFMSLSKPYSKPFSSSEQGSRHSSCTDVSGSSTTRRDPTTNESSRIMSTTSTTTTTTTITRSTTPGSLVDIRRQVATSSASVARTVIVQPLLASYTLPDVECMIQEAGKEILGRGGFGYVCKGKLPNGNSVAIKFLHENSRQGHAEFLNEVQARKIQPDFVMIATNVRQSLCF